VDQFQISLLGCEEVQTFERMALAMCATAFKVIFFGARDTERKL
jgi:hypothetical protein